MPGPRKDAAELRLALSYDDLKMNGMPALAQMSLSLPGDIHVKVARFDDAGPGDEEERPVESDVEATQLHRDQCAYRRPKRTLRTLGGRRTS
jgi:hypothetical protein